MTYAKRASDLLELLIGGAAGATAVRLLIIWKPQYQFKFYLIRYWRSYFYSGYHHRSLRYWMAELFSPLALSISSIVLPTMARLPSAAFHHYPGSHIDDGLLICMLFSGRWGALHLLVCRIISNPILFLDGFAWIRTRGMMLGRGSGTHLNQWTILPWFLYC